MKATRGMRQSIALPLLLGVAVLGTAAVAQTSDQPMTEPAVRPILPPPEASPTATPGPTAGETYGPPAPVSTAATVAIPVVAAPPGVPDALLRAAATATENYPAIRTAEAELNASRSDLKSARWLRFPSVTVDALAVTRGSRNASQDPFTAQLAVEQPVFTFGRIGGTIDRAEALWFARRAGVDETARQVALRVVDAFYNVALGARRQAVLEEGLGQHRDLLQTIQNRVRQEVSPQSDLDLAMSRVAQMEQELALAMAQRSSALRQLIELIGTSSFDFGNVPEYDPQIAHPSQQGAIDRALACDPTIERLRAETAAAEAEAKVARAGIFPQVLGQVTHNEITGTRAGVVLRAQPGAGLSQVEAANAARARIRAAEFEISTAERQLREQLDLDFVTNRSSRERVEAGIQAATTSQLVTESYKRQFITGRRTWLDVMNAVREATTSKLSKADGEIGAMASNARIWLRTCGWQPRPLDPGALEPKK